MTAADPGATPTAARALAPDLARGGMLLLIALANGHAHLFGRPTGPLGYPRDLDGVDRVVTVLQVALVDGRAYPLFGLLFGYGVVQLARRRAAVGLPAAAVVAVVRRRGAWMVAIGFAHAVLLFSGDIVGAYGLLAVVGATALVRGTDSGLLVMTAVGLSLLALFSLASGLSLGDDGLLPSMAVPDAVTAALMRAAEWTVGTLVGSVVSVFAAVVLGAWAGRRGYLDVPDRHRRLLTGIAVAGLAAAVLGGLPLALMSAQVWAAPPLPVVLLAGGLHGLSGYAGALGYAALFGLLAARIARRGGPGPVGRAVRACGQRSLSCYLAQSVAFAALLPAWSSGLGAQARVWQAALLAVGVWLVLVLVAAASDRAGQRGPAEVLLRRLTYGRRARQTT